ncbi:MgtC/SapB family protein [Bradyrhizobium sp. WD16]|uniref:MgtC/SapB family protein n=1 Tax=Bradyrhizobium sp. WD16 TaxID=1521768 RepID=UPI0020A534DA|nr:DUF4010 domain-containing protein [Bradyrhizobium sp. WD16]UTD27538.1 hypothetical protein DB459_12015 [Bradyrhizobium sp. WD16]
MDVADSVIVKLAVALGIGLLIGLERERRKGEGPQRAAAGLRTYAITALAGGISVAAGGVQLLAVTTAGVVVFAAAAYLRFRDDDPGLTSEMALVLTVLLGGLALQNPTLAAGLGVILAGLLAARAPLHHFVRRVMTARELNDLIIFAAAALVVLPLLPDRATGPYGAVNPHGVWTIVVLVMAISALGHIATRLLGARFGLPLAGFASGFVSSIATIGAMAGRAARDPKQHGAAVAGAVLSTVATVIQMAAVLAAVSRPVLSDLAPALMAAGITATLYGLAFTWRAIRSPAPEERSTEAAFSLTAALAFAAVLTAVLLASAALRETFGAAGILVGALLAGFADTHATAASVASLAAAQKMTAADAVAPILAALSSNTLSKIAVAAAAGGRSFALRVIPGLVLVILAAWAGAYGSRLMP